MSAQISAAVLSASTTSASRAPSWAAAWLAVQPMGGVADEYPYYAPLGALLSMHSTLKGSAKYGLQILAGLALGILLAFPTLMF